MAAIGLLLGPTMIYLTMGLSFGLFLPLLRCVSGDASLDRVASVVWSGMAGAGLFALWWLLIKHRHLPTPALPPAIRRCLLLGVLALACAFVVMLRGDPVGGWTRPTTLVPLYLVGGGPALFLLLVWTQYLRRRDPPPPSGEERL